MQSVTEKIGRDRELENLIMTKLSVREIYIEMASVWEMSNTI